MTMKGNPALHTDTAIKGMMSVMD